MAHIIVFFLYLHFLRKETLSFNISIVMKSESVIIHIITATFTRSCYAVREGSNFECISGILKCDHSNEIY